MVKDCFPLRSGIKQLTLTTLFNQNTETSNHRNKARKRNERHIDWKRRKKSYLFIDNMILYVENPKKSIKILPAEFGKVTGYQIH